MRPLVRRCWERVAGREDEAAEDGSAVVEFIFLGVLLIVPLIYFILTVSQVQAAAYATSNATQGATTVLAQAPDEVTGRERAESLKRFAYADFGLNPDAGAMTISCAGSCLAPGSKVTVSISYSVDLPLFSNVFGSGLKVVQLNDSATAYIPRYR